MYAVILVATLVVVKLTHWLYQWSNPKCNGILPPGSMGFPIIGETIHFFTPYSLYEIQPYIKTRMARYGSVFRSCIAGQKVVVSTDPEMNHSIMNQENKSLLFWCTDGLSTKVFGQENFLSQHGSVHKYLRNLVTHLTGREVLRLKFLREIDQTTRTHLQSWASSGTVDVRQACAEMVFESCAKKLISYDEKKYSMKLRQNYRAFKLGIVSFPLYIPGFAFYECIKGRRHIRKVIKEMYQERKASKVEGHDFLDRVVEEVGKENPVLNDENAIDLLFVLIFAAFETVSQSITLVTKYINDHPHVLDELTKEHEAILSHRRGQDHDDDQGINSEVTWEEYKSMNFTHMVINETVRLANIVPVTFRKVLKDMEINGYTIPEGWVIMMALPIVHFDPNKYEDPLAFNPWRWKGKEMHTGTKSFMGFGGGVRLCAGADFAKVHLAVYIHYLVTRYRWSVTKGGEVVKQPGLKFPNGLHVQIAEKETHT